MMNSSQVMVGGMSLVKLSINLDLIITGLSYGSSGRSLIFTCTLVAASATPSVKDCIPFTFIVNSVTISFDISLHSNIVAFLHLLIVVV